MTDWLTYVQNIVQPSFVGPFDVVGPIVICLQRLCRTPALLESWSYLANGSLNKAKNDERDVVRSERNGQSDSEHGVLAGEVDRLSTESISHRREDDGANHDAEVEHRLRHLHQVVLVAY